MRVRVGVGLRARLPSRYHITRLGDQLTLSPVWDIRSIRKPIAVASDLGNIYSETNLAFSPDDRQILTGLPAPRGPAGEDGERKQGMGSLVFLDATNLQETRRVIVGQGSVVRVLWHSRINQVRSCLYDSACRISEKCKHSWFFSHPRRLPHIMAPIQTLTRHKLTPHLDIRLPLHRRNPRPLLPQLIPARCPPPSLQNAPYSPPRPVILHCRPETRHFQSGRTTNVCRQGGERVVASKGKTSEKDETSGTDEWARTGWAVGGERDAGVGAEHVSVSVFFVGLLVAGCWLWVKFLCVRIDEKKSGWEEIPGWRRDCRLNVKGLGAEWQSAIGP